MIIVLHPAHEGVVRRQSIDGAGAAPAGVACNHAPGTPRFTVRPHYGGLPLIGWTRTGRTRAKARGIRVARRPLSGPGSTAPRCETPRWSAAKRGVSALETPHAKPASGANCVHLFAQGVVWACGGSRNDGAARAANNRAGGALATPRRHRRTWSGGDARDKRGHDRKRG